MRNERGLAPSVEAAVLLPALAMFIGLVVTLAHVALAQQEVRALAASAARAASLERTSGQGRGAAQSMIDSVKHCTRPRAAINTAALSHAPGVEGIVSVHLSCTVRFESVGLRSLPGSVTVSAESSSPVDRYRSR